MMLLICRFLYLDISGGINERLGKDMQLKYVNLDIIIIRTYVVYAYLTPWTTDA